MEVNNELWSYVAPKKIILTNAEPQSYGANRLGGSDEDRSHKNNAINSLRKRSEEVQGYAKQAYQKAPSECTASLQQQNSEEEEAVGMKYREHGVCDNQACLGYPSNRRR